MALRVVRLGSPRAPGEGLRLGTVRRPPRGVPKSEFASQHWYDVWFPNLAPSSETMKLGQAAETPAQWAAFGKQCTPEHPLGATMVSSEGACAAYYRYRAVPEVAEAA